MGLAMTKMEDVSMDVAPSLGAKDGLTVVEGGRQARWHVVRSKPGAVFTAKENLERQKFEVYVPMAMRPGPARNGKPTSIVSPLFHRYVFVRFDSLADQWRSIFSTRGVSDMLMLNDARPAYMPDRDIDYIKAREEHGFIKLGVADDPKSCRFKEGQKVKVGVGMWADLEAVFVEPLDSGRAAILVTFLGKETRQEVTLLSIK